MPFTGSHAAAVLPLARLGLPASALVIGSMVPDLPYYLTPLGHAKQTHTLSGVLWVDLPLGLVALLTWQALVGPAVVALAPPPAADRLAAYPIGPRRTLGGLRPFATSVAALILGSATHVAWDSFTHVGGWVVTRVGWLRADLGPLAAYRWAQYASGAAGAVIVAIWCAQWWRRHPPAAAVYCRSSRAARVASTAAVVIAAAAGAILGAVRHESSLRTTLFNVATASGGWTAAALLIIAVLWIAASRLKYRHGEARS
jgi:hypothetical protein